MNLRLRTYVNDEVRQDGNTKDMLYNIYEQIEYLSTALTLEVGDVIATGTPAGVAWAEKDPRWMEAGDIVRIEIERIGILENPITNEK